MTIDSACKLLDVSVDAALAEVKKAYRIKAKALHPDINPDPRAALLLLEVINAYKMLLDLHRSGLIDQLQKVKLEDEFDYRSFLKEKGDPLSLAQLVFYDLLNLREDDAVELFLEQNRLNNDILSALDTEDYMDCAYIMAEELYLRNFFTPALDLLVEICRLELLRNYFKFFFQDIKDMLRKVIEGLSANCQSPVDFQLIMERLIQMDFPEKDKGYFFKALADFYLKRNQRTKALLYLTEAMRLDPKAKGLAELRRKLEKMMERSK